MSCSAEAQAARIELTVKTDELGKRLAALEALVVGVSDALAELRPAAPHAAAPLATARSGRVQGHDRRPAEPRSSGPDVSASDQSVPYRKIGSIFVEKQLITPGQLALALEEQEKTGRLLGEICVARFGVDRIAPGRCTRRAMGRVAARGCSGCALRRGSAACPADEAHATRAELRLKTGQLNKRLGTLETLVAGVNEALAHLTSAAGPAGQAAAKPAAPRKRSTATRARSTKPEVRVGVGARPARYAHRRSGMGPVAQQVFKTCAVV